MHQNRLKKVSVIIQITKCMLLNAATILFSLDRQACRQASKGSLTYFVDKEMVGRLPAEGFVDKFVQV